MIRLGFFSLLMFCVLNLVPINFSFAQELCNAECEESGRQRLAPKLNICGWCMCAFDFNADLIFLYRKSESSHIDFASEGISGKRVLSSKNLDSGWQNGWRLTAGIFFDNCDYLEATYLSGGDWSDSKSVRSSANDLYSIFSLYGANPFGGYNGTDNASLQKIGYSSEFYTWEVNYRNHVSIFEIPRLCCLDGSLLYGYRYFNLDESFRYKAKSNVNSAEMLSRVDTGNSMHGLQVGAEGWFPMSACIDFGFEVKGALYFNCYDQKTTIIAEADLTEPLHEKKSDWGSSWGIEASAKICYEFASNFYLRAGYLYLYLDDVALAAGNFNTKSPFEEGRRHKKLNHSGNVAYHGATIGIDWCW